VRTKRFAPCISRPLRINHAILAQSASDQRAFFIPASENLSILVASIGAPLTQADIMYTRAGNPFTIFHGGVDSTNDFVSGFSPALLPSGITSIQRLQMERRHHGRKRTAQADAARQRRVETVLV
jgi:hypothetical protein